MAARPVFICSCHRVLIEPVVSYLNAFIRRGVKVKRTTCRILSGDRRRCRGIAGAGDTIRQCRCQSAAGSRGELAALINHFADRIREGGAVHTIDYNCANRNHSIIALISCLTVNQCRQKGRVICADGCRCRRSFCLCRCSSLRFCIHRLSFCPGGRFRLCVHRLCFCPGGCFRLCIYRLCRRRCRRLCRIRFIRSRRHYIAISVIISIGIRVIISFVIRRGRARGGACLCLSCFCRGSFRLFCSCRLCLFRLCCRRRGRTARRRASCRRRTRRGASCRGRSRRRAARGRRARGGAACRGRT